MSDWLTCWGCVRKDERIEELESALRCLVTECKRRDSDRSITLFDYGFALEAAENVIGDVLGERKVEL